jgi:hypothetical protein
MKQKQLIIYDSFIIYIDRYIYESDEMFYFRINYIYNNITKNEKIENIEKIIADSMIEMNMKFLNCNF